MTHVVARIAVTAVAVAVVAPAAALAAARAVHRETKLQVEITLVRSPRALARIAPGLIEKHTNLVRTNTQAVCAGVGAPVNSRFHLFRCVLRSKTLHVSIAAEVLAHGGLALRRLTTS